MLTDLFLSFHKLIRYRKIVKWHWLPLLAAWYLFLIILKNWWELAFFQESSDWMNIFYFIAYGHLLVLIFLLVSTALPDDIQKNGVELKAYYFENHRYFWGLMSTVVLVSLSIDIIKRFHIEGSFNIINILGNSIFIFLTIIMAITKKYWVHAIILFLLVIQIILELFNK